MTQSKAPLWFVVALFASLHFLLVAGLTFYCIDRYYDQPCPFDPLAYVLLSPAYLVLIYVNEPSIGLLLVPINSLLWGWVLAKLFGRWFAWPPWYFSLRTLLIAMTLVVVAIGVVVVLVR